jgi:naphthoate synthase/2-ketocyclohexanecarboxyl-CoA hydrolase
LDEEVDKWCEEILSLNPDCIEVLKATFDSEIDYMVGSNAVLSRLMYPDWFDGEAIKEAQRAFLEKRKADYWITRRKKNN